ncbi:DUF3592 domain-containing protein [Dactylosporangium sp. NPDC005572]|uniref:DUF3592 domain-containing protein n=1 Tax=Dactylosporangium sp. NPDC005572 TaxID=3156889 RepID=UPI0033A5C0B8
MWSLLSIIPVIVGISVTFNVIKAMRKGREFKSRAVRVMGMVVDLKWSYVGSNQVAMPVFNYHTREGHPMQATETVGTNPPRFRPGRPVVVLYDPHEPYKAHLEGLQGAATLLQGVALVLGPLFALGGLLSLAATLLG